MSMLKQAISIAAFAAGSALAQPALAQEIVAPTSATINSGGPGFGSINDTLNQNGLASNYVSGVTNFNAYIATNPQHSLVFAGNEWFSNEGSTSASVTYDLGGIMGIDALALWNEDFSGIGTLGLFGSTDDLAYFALGLFNPTDVVNNTNYGPQVFTFTASDLRFVRFDMSGCPQQPGGFDACAIGEVAFRTAEVNGAIPEPGTWGMMLLGFAGVGMALRRRRPKMRALAPAA
jgi:hypothetical protein